MKRMLVSDYDNTFYTDDYTLIKNIAKVKQFREKGNLFVIATSRNLASINKEIKRYNIEYDYIICNTGSIIMDSKNNSIYTHFLDFESVVQIEGILKSKESLEITRFTIQKKLTLDNIIGYKIKGKNSLLKKIKKEIEDNMLNIETIYQSQNKLFINGKTKKEDAIEIIYKRINEPIDIITVGDDIVDIGMIKKYNGYRMKNSCKEMKKIIKKEIEHVFQLLEINEN